MQFNVTKLCPQYGEISQCLNSDTMKKHFVKNGSIEGCAGCCAGCLSRDTCPHVCEAVRPTNSLALSDADRAALADISVSPDNLRPLVELEAEIKAHGMNLVTDILTIGRDLIEAKAQLGHGNWLTWLEEKAGLSSSTAGNFMRIAREVRITPALTRLSYSKVLPLLSLPAAEREAVMQETDAEHISARQLREAIKARKQAEEQAQRLQNELEQTRQQHSKRMADAADRAAQLQGQYNELQEQLRAKEEAEPVTVRVPVITPPADYEALKRRVEEAEEFARASEQAQQEAEEELQRLRQSGIRDDESGIADGVRAACGTFMATAGMHQYADFGLCTRDELASIEQCVQMMKEWAQNAADGLAIARSAIIIDADTLA